MTVILPRRPRMVTIFGYKGFDKVDGIEVAWNQVSLNQAFQTKEHFQRIHPEVHLLKTLNHENILKPNCSWVDDDKKTINMITELFTSGSLRQYHRKHRASTRKLPGIGLGKFFKVSWRRQQRGTGKEFRRDGGGFRQQGQRGDFLKGNGEKMGEKIVENGVVTSDDQGVAVVEDKRDTVEKLKKDSSMKITDNHQKMTPHNSELDVKPSEGFLLFY